MLCPKKHIGNGNCTQHSNHRQANILPFYCGRERERELSLPYWHAQSRQQTAAVSAAKCHLAPATEWHRFFCHVDSCYVDRPLPSKSHPPKIKKIIGSSKLIIVYSYPCYKIYPNVTYIKYLGKDAMAAIKNMALWVCGLLRELCHLWAFLVLH